MQSLSHSHLGLLSISGAEHFSLLSARLAFYKFVSILIAVCIHVASNCAKMFAPGT